MNWSSATAVAAAASILGVPGALAHDPDHEHPASLGTVNFPVSCTPEAQQRFNTAASVLYSFYWERIDAAIADVLAADPDCAMAYWAKAIASLDNAARLAADAEEGTGRMGGGADGETAGCEDPARAGLHRRRGNRLQGPRHRSLRHARSGLRKGAGADCICATRRTPRPRCSTPSGCRSPRIATTRPMRSSSRARRSWRRYMPPNRSTRCRTFPDPRLRLPGDRRARAACGEALRLDRPGLAARTAHAVAHLLARRAMAGFDRQQYPVTRGVEDGPRRLPRARLHGVRGPAARARRRRPRNGSISS